MLHDVLSQRKIRTWQKSYEDIMIKCVPAHNAAPTKHANTTRTHGV